MLAGVWVDNYTPDTEGEMKNLSKYVLIISVFELTGWETFCWNITLLYIDLISS
mgnify:CR=1 FL=1